MKKYKNWIIGGLVVILLIIGASVSGGGEPKATNVKKISYSDYEELAKGTEPFVIVIAQTGCGYCDQFKPIAEEVSREYDITINWIDITQYSQENYAKLEDSISYLKNEEWGTPTTLIIKDGDNIEDVIGGYVEKEEFVNYLKDNGIIE